MNFQAKDGLLVGTLIEKYPWETLPDGETLMLLEFKNGAREVFRLKDLIANDEATTEYRSSQVHRVTCAICGVTKEIESDRKKTRHYRCSPCRTISKPRQGKEKQCPVSGEEVIALYEGKSIQALASHFSAGKKTVRRWVIQAGGTIRK